MIALVGFALAVGLDAAGNPAAAVDLGPATFFLQSSLPVQMVPLQSVTSGGPYPEGGDPTVEVGLADQLARARRLHHGRLTSALMTSNRLTDAHLFTDVPSN